MSYKVKGFISAMVTPFTKGGEYVDFDKIGPLATRLVDQGAEGLFPCGTTGEGMLLSAEERKEVFAEVCQAVGKKTQIVAHTGCLDTATTIELTQYAQKIGATAAAIVAPAFYSYDDEALETFYKSIAKAAEGFPILLYNIPGCAKNELRADLVLKLAESVENIVGIKDSSGNMGYLTRLIGNAPKDFAVINGVDEYGYQALLAGAAGLVSGTSNVVCELYRSVYDHVRKGNLKKAWAQQVTLEKCTRIFQYGSKVAIFKEGSRLRGFDAGYVRPPQRELTAAEKRTLAKALKEVGVL